jgi:hypothetical protein
MPAPAMTWPTVTSLEPDPCEDDLRQFEEWEKVPSD